MAIATKKSPPPAPSRAEAPHSPNPILRAVDAVYRFLASLKLAVLSLGSLAAVLAYATVFESTYGTAAAQEWIYRSPWFAVLLAFLATNILCAALIRFPWTRRQTGFVITHAGLLVLLAGSWVTLQYADEGRVGLAEGERTSELIRVDYPVLRVRGLDPETRRPEGVEYIMPFRPGSFAWGPGRYEVLSQEKDPFKLAVKASLPASTPPRSVFEPSGEPRGTPMIRAALLFKAPGMEKPRDALQAGGFAARDPHWLVADNKFAHDVADLGPAKVAFQFVEEAEQVADFVDPPRATGDDGAVRFHYKDKDGKDRQFDWDLAGQAEKTVALPDSDLKVKLDGVKTGPAGADLGRATGESNLSLAIFRVSQGAGAPVTHFAWADLPTIPNFIGGHAEAEGGRQLVRISYFRPALDGGFGRIEVVGTPDRKLSYRVIGRDGLRAAGPLAMGRDIAALGGGKVPMEITFRVDEFYPAGRERTVCEPLELSKERKGEGIPACLVELTVDGKTEEVWVRKSPGLDADFETVAFPGGPTFQVAYDVDRKDLGFSVALDDFEVKMDPGTQQPAGYRSDVRLTDEAHGIKDKPVTISMNRTMEHRGWTFYQSSYERVRDPATGRPSGKFRSIFQVGSDPGRWLKYGGGALVFFGAIVQFYMRAGIFTDGGKKERARAEARARKRAGRDGDGEAPAPAAEPL